jgi:hypothetical protein
MTSDDTVAYAEGSVWSVQFARTKPGATAAYLRHLSEAWKPVMEEAQRREIVLSYRILLSNLTGPSDWDVMIMIELKNMAALDGYAERMGRLVKDLGAAGGGGCRQFLEDFSEYMRLTREVNLR